jgi:hypothetical protein
MWRQAISIFPSLLSDFNGFFSIQFNDVVRNAQLMMPERSFVL